MINFIHRAFKNIVFISFLLIFISPAEAMLLSSGPFMLEGGVVKPRQTLRIILKSLPTPGLFDVSCEIENPKYDQPYPVVLSMGCSPGCFGIYLNGGRVYYAQGKLDRYINYFNAQGLSNIYLVEFYNNDATDSVIVKNCIGTYTTEVK